MRTSWRSAFAAITAVIALGVIHQTASASRGPVPAASRQAALANIATAVLLPAYAELAARADDFAHAAETLTAAPALPALQATQRAWRDTLLAWRRTQAFAHGPVADLGLSGRMQFWPSRRSNIDRVLRAQRPIDDRYVQELGANAVGLSALELLLFDVREDDGSRIAALSGPGGDRRRTYLLALAHELATSARAIDRAWRGPAGYAATFAAGGQPQLNLLVNDLLTAVETGAQGRLRVALDKGGEPQFASELVEGGLSGVSQQALLSLLTGARDAFAGKDGAGLDDYLRQLNPAVARRIDAQFQKTVEAVRAIGLPLERAAQAAAPAVSRAYDECRALEILLKVEVASNLGVTLTFKSTDGD